MKNNSDAALWAHGPPEKTDVSTAKEQCWLRCWRGGQGSFGNTGPVPAELLASTCPQDGSTQCVPDEHGGNKPIKYRPALGLGRGESAFCPFIASSQIQKLLSIKREAHAYFLVMAVGGISRV